MDHFGIGAAVEGSAQIYFRSARQTGRTTQLIQSLQDGDRVVVHSHKQAQWLTRRAKELGKDIDVIACPIERPEKVFEQSTSKGRTIFDHDWVEQYYMRSIKIAQEQLNYYERESSGWGPAHEETLMQAEALQKWRIRG